MEDGEERNKRDREVCLCSRRQVIVWCVGVSLIVLLIIITLLSVFLTARSDASVNIESFPSGGDMLDFLLQTGEIPEKDGLYATWYHSANNKSEMNEALKGDVMILEADVTVEGYNTANETRIPIMAHPPDVYSDNTLEEWLDAVLKFRKGIKLDFKTISAVEPALDLLMVKNQTGINRPVWLNADILPGPNVPDFWPVISASEFFRLIERKFPDVTISPGWKVLYISIFPNVTYTRHMVEQMYSSVRHLQQNITFPVHALMARNGWPHLNWLLSRSSRFSLTLWQGKENPSVNDLLFIRDNSDPQSIYYDIYEPVLSQFKEAANLKNRPRRFYSGGDIVNYFRPVNDDGLNIQWETVSQKDSFLSLLNGLSGAMLVILVSSSPSQGNIPVVHGSQPELLLRDVLESIFSSKKKWGLYFKIKTQNELDLTLEVLREAYDREHLHHPTWVSMDVSHGAFSHHGYITGKDFLRSVGDIFPFVTLAPGWPEEVLEHGYTPQLVVDMMELFQDTWQDVSLQLKPEALGRSRAGWRRLISAQSRFSLTLLRWKCSTSVKVDKESLLSVRAANKQRCFYNMPKMYREHIANLSEKHYPFFLQDL